MAAIAKTDPTYDPRFKKIFSLANARHQYIDIPYLFQPMSKILVLPPPPSATTPQHTHTLLNFLTLYTYEDLHIYEMRRIALNNRIDWRSSMVYLDIFKSLYQCIDLASSIYLGRSSIQNKSCWKNRNVYTTFNGWFQQKRGAVMYMIISTDV